MKIYRWLKGGRGRKMNWIELETIMSPTYTIRSRWLKRRRLCNTNRSCMPLSKGVTRRPSKLSR